MRSWFVGLLVALLAVLVAMPPAIAQGDGFGTENEQEDVVLSESETTVETDGGFPTVLVATTNHDEHSNTPGARPCAVHGTADTTGPMSAEEAQRLADEAAAEEQAHLDAVIAARAQSDVRLVNAKSARYTPEPAQDTKTPKSATGRRAGQTGEPHIPNPDAVIEIFENEAAENEANNPTDGSGTPAEPVCILHYYCAGERVDDVVFGHISDEPDGAFHDYVNIVGLWILGVAGTVAFDEFVLDTDALAGSIIEGGLGSQPSLTTMPVFYYCRRGEGGDIEVFDPDYSPSFTWATDVNDQYDIPGARIESIETLRAVLRGNRPQMETIPPISTGYTFVQLPMWFWLTNPPENVFIEAISEEGTARLATRATPLDVTWEVGDETFVCELDEMEPFVTGVDKITDPVSPCSHRFTELVDYTVTATVRYRVEEQVSFRGALGFAWPAAGWVPHPTNPIVTVDNQTGTMSVRQIVSVDVPIGVNAEELRAVVDGG